MLREKLKGKVLKPLLLLAAMFALSQSASAWSHYYLRSSGGTNNADYNKGLRYELTWNASTKCYEASGVEITEATYFKVTASDSANTDTNWYGSSSAQTVNGNTEFDLSQNSNDFQIQPGTYDISMQPSGNNQGYNPAKIKFTKATTPPVVSSYTYFINYQKVAGNDGAGWADSPNFTIKGGESASTKLTLKNGVHFGIKTGNTFYGPAGSDHMNVQNGSECTSFGNSKHFIWNADEAEVTITVTLNASGEVSKVTFSTETVTPDPTDTYVAFWLNNNGWAHGEVKTSNAAGDLVLTAEMTNGMQFGFRTSTEANINTSNSTWWGSNGTTDIVNGTVISSFKSSGGDMYWKGGDGTVTATLTLDAEGNITKAVFAGPEAVVTPPEPITGKYYLRGDWTNGWAELGQKAFDEYGKLTITGYDLSKRFKVWYPENNWSQVTGQNVRINGQDMTLNTLLKGTADVTFTLTVDASGTPIGLSATWTNYVPEAIEVTAGMPFYPHGIRNETQFAAAAATNDSYYYLVGTSLNVKIESPEWELVKQTEGPNAGKYVCDFTYHGGYSDNWIYVTKFQSVNSTSTVVAYKGRNATTNNGNGYVNLGTFNSARYRAVYDPSKGDGTDNGNDACLQIIPLHYNDATASWEEVKGSNTPDRFPFVSLIGESWKQMDGVPLNISNIPSDQTGSFSGWTTTESGWQQSWIQYNEYGEAITSRDKSKVYFNLQFPPVNPIMFVSRFTLDGKEYDLGLNSGSLTFSLGNNGVELTGAEWKAMKTINPKGKLDLEDGRKYRMYVVENVWANGKFKLWSGWNGQRFNASSTGANWSQNWNWGEGQQLPTSTEISVGETYKLGTKEGDMNFAQPTYMRYAYFFFDVEKPHEVNYSRFYTRKAVGGAQIQALSNDDYSRGLFYPQVTDVDASTTITGIKLTIYRVSDDRVIRELIDVDGLDLTKENFADGFKEHFANSAVANYFNDGFSYRNSGWYYYGLVVEFSDGETANVKSNPYYIRGNRSSLVAAQLVQVNKATAPEALRAYDYVTYNIGATEAYGVVYDTNLNSVTKVETIAVPAPTFYASKEQATWTNKVLLYATLPWEGEDADEGMIGSTARYWNFYSCNPKSSKEEADTYSETPIKVGSGTTPNETGPLMYIANGPDIFEHFYKVELVYDSKDVAGNQVTGLQIPMTRAATMRIPTPRMVPGKYDAIITFDAAPRDVTVVGDAHTGVFKGSYSASAIEYPQARVRHLSIKTYLEMPNATADLINLIPGDEDGNYYRDTRFAGDKWITDNLEKTKVNLRDTEDVESYMYFVDQDIHNWIEKDGDSYVAIPRNVTFDFEKNGRLIQFYERKAHGVTIEIDPEFVAPKLSKPHIYRFQYADPTQDNIYRERLVLATVPVENQTSKLHETELTVNTDNAYYAVSVDGEAIGETGNDHDYSTNKLIHYTPLCSDKATVFVIDDVEIGHWYAGMDQDVFTKQSFNLGVGHGFIFETTNHGVRFNGAISHGNVPKAAAPQFPTESFTVFTPNVTEIPVLATDIQTSVDVIGAEEDVMIVAGEGFIDMLGNTANVFTTAGAKVYTGAGRVDLPAGIYVVATAAKTFKVVVK